MFKFLKKPHPFIFNIYSIVVPSIVTFMLLTILAPLQFQGLDMPTRTVTALLVSFIVALSILVTVTGMKRLLPKFMQEEKWTVGKELLLVVVAVLLIILLMSAIVLLSQDKSASTGSLVFQIASITIGISIFPILILVLFEQYRHQKIQVKRAAALTNSLKKENKLLKNSESERHLFQEKLLIRAENNEIELQIQARNLVYLNSSGNYVDLFYLDSNSLKKQLIRNTLKNIEATLPPRTFLRCHNRYIVNGHHIIKIEGNARSLMLHLREVVEPIPVSRTKAKSISRFIENLS